MDRLVVMVNKIRLLSRVRGGLYTCVCGMGVWVCGCTVYVCVWGGGGGGGGWHTVTTGADAALMTGCFGHLVEVR